MSFHKKSEVLRCSKCNNGLQYASESKQGPLLWCDKCDKLYLYTGPESFVIVKNIPDYLISEAMNELFLRELK